MREEELQDLSTGDLLDRALEITRRDCDADADLRWACVSALHQRPEDEVFRTASAWCESRDPSERSLGADILGQLGHLPPAFESPFADRSGPILLGMLQDAEPAVVESAIIALGHLANVGAAWDSARLVPLASNPDPEIRQAVAFALGGARSDDSSVAVETMITLSRDPEVDVRSWATFGLGVLSDADGAEVREALWSLVDDADHEVRGEALVGLARRSDPRALRAIREEFDRDTIGILAVEAAAELGAQELLPALESLLEEWPEEGSKIREAIERCRGGT
jgi:HEAT repeat protein